MDHEPAAPYDLIVSLSTMEHVGQDDDRHEPAKAIAAIERVHGWLAPGGELLVTVPLGYNAALDARLVEGPPLFDSTRFMRRLDAQNSWREASPADLRGTRFNSPFPFANAIAIGRSSG